MRHSILLRCTLAVLVAIGAFWFGSHAIEILWSSGFTDFGILFRSAQRVAQGHSPYLRGLFNAPFGGYYKYPPLVALLVAPLTGFDWLTLARIYALLGLLCYAFTFVLLTRLVSLPLFSPSFFLLALAFLFSQPALDTLEGAQHEFFILFLFTVAYWGMLHPRYGEFIGGMSFGIVAMVKVYPIFILPFLLIRRALRAVGTLIVTFLGLLVFSVIIAGWDLQRQFWFLILPKLSGATAWLENQSFFAFFARLFVDGAVVDPTRVTRLPFATWASYVAMALACLISFVVMERDSRPQFAFSIWLPLVLLLGPNSWIHYQVLLLLPLAILLAEFQQGASIRQWGLLLLAAGLITFGNELTLLEIHVGWIQSYKFYGVLGFWSLALYLAWTRSENKESVPQFILRCRLRLGRKGRDVKT